jgi:hypothetical protein
MGCCGGKRQQIKVALGGAEPSPGAAQPPRAAVVFEFFRYTGNTGMTVVGPITGKRYRFNAPGAVVAVDARDAPGVGAAPNLRQVVKVKEHSRA